MAEVDIFRARHTSDVPPFQVLEINPNAFQSSVPAIAEQFSVRAQQVRDIVESSWRAKFATGDNPVLSPEAISAYTQSKGDLKDVVAHPHNSGRYLMAFEETAESLEPQAMARVELYDPGRLSLGGLRSAAQYGRKYPYQNVTDLETLNGEVSRPTKYGPQAAALLYHALQSSTSDRKVAAYTEEKNPDGIQFYEGLGFKIVGTAPDDVLPFPYVHMEAPSRDEVRAELRHQNDFLWLQSGRPMLGGGGAEIG